MLGLKTSFSLHWKERERGKERKRERKREKTRNICETIELKSVQRTKSLRITPTKQQPNAMSLRIL